MMKLFEIAYQKTLEPREKIEEFTENFEYFEKSLDKIIYCENDDRLSYILQAKSIMGNSDLLIAKEKIKNLINSDPEQFFIGNYK